MKCLKTGLVILLLAVSHWAIACEAENISKGKQYLDQAFALFLQNNGKVSDDVIALADKAVAECPSEGRFLLERANLKLLGGQYEQAKQDYKVSESYNPLPAEVLTLKCVLQEYTHEEKSEWVACYQQAAQRYTQSQKDLPDGTYVITLLLSESANADAVKDQWLLKNKGNEDYIELEQILNRSWQRQELMKMIYPLM